MNILLVRPKPHKNSISLQSFMICEPLELEYLSAYMESFGHSVEIIDLIIENKPINYFLKSRRVDVVGFTGYLPHVGIIKKYAETVKRYNAGIKTIVGGIHAEVVPQDFEDKNIDFIIKANGLKTFKEILERTKEDVRTVRTEVMGVWKDNTKKYVIDTEFEYPFPDRNKTKKYREHYNYIYHEKCATLKTSFGCPYRCEFCFCTQITRNKYFTRKIENVIEEIKLIEENNIFIVDDNFLVEVNRIKKFRVLLNQNNIHKNFILFGRADFIVQNEDTIKMLKECGLKAIFIGLESFKEEELKNFNKNTTVEMNIQAVKILEKLELECYSGIIVGNDWEKKDFDRLISFLNDFEHPMMNIQPITPIPGTPLYERIKGDVIISRDKYELWDMAHLLLKPTKLSARQFYYHMVRVYRKTSINQKAHQYIIKKYGMKVYLRCLKGVIHIAWQYAKLMIS